MEGKEFPERFDKGQTIHLSAIWNLVSNNYLWPEFKIICKENLSDFHLETDKCLVSPLNTCAYLNSLPHDCTPHLSPAQNETGGEGWAPFLLTRSSHSVK